MTAHRLHLGIGHPVASVAAGHCVAHDAPLVGGVACGACWEQAIRDDERFAVQFGLPRELRVDPQDVDTIAVERACLGDPVPLSEAEIAAAARRLRRHGLTLRQIGDLLGISQRLVCRTVDGVVRGRRVGRARAEDVAA